MIFLFIQIVTCAGQMVPMSSEDAKRGTEAPSDSRSHVTTIEKVPHHVLVVYHNLYCSGSLINSRLVLTAASCFSRLTNNNKVIIKLGSDSVVGPGDLINVVQVKLHEFFTQLSDMDNDIAMLVLEFSVAFKDSVKKIPLLRDHLKLVDGTDLLVSGWGSTNLAQKFLNKLLWSDMTILNIDRCRLHYGTLITPSNFCAYYSMNRRLSDNGGGAIFDNKLAGIVSFGANNKESPNVAVFTNVSYFYRWITVNARKFLNMYCIKLHDSDADEYTSESLEHQSPGEVGYDEDEHHEPEDNAHANNGDKKVKMKCPQDILE